MPGPSSALERAARRAAHGTSRRELLRLAAGATLVAAMPSVAWGTRPPRPIVKKTRGLCATEPLGTCPEGLVPGAWSKDAKIVIPNGVPSRFNGCGPEAGVDLLALGASDIVPDEPLKLASFFAGCKGHDCCYGRCGSSKAECDFEFLKDSLQACARDNPGTDPVALAWRSNCNKMASVYFHAVGEGEKGQAAWEAAQLAACFSCQPCAEDLLNDPANCGACGNRCADGVLCCQGICSDPQVDDNHCGACGNVCGPAQKCIGGQCVGCEAPEVVCGGACCNSKTHECRDNRCVKRCVDTETPCGDSCCTGDQVCRDGVCVAEQCREGTYLCGSECCGINRPCIDGGCGYYCEGGVPCGYDRECCFYQTEDERLPAVCCPAGTYCSYNAAILGKCKPNS